jgi:hypothetical protein
MCWGERQGGEMTVKEILESVRFVVDLEGRPSAAVVDMPTWEALLDVLEEVEDLELVRERLSAWRSKEGWTAWELFDAELADDAL